MNIEFLKHKSLYLMPINAISLSLCIIFQSEGYDVCGIWDNNDHAKDHLFRDIKISPPQAISAEDGSFVVIICSHQSNRGIQAQLESLGIKDIYGFEKIVTSEDEQLLIDTFKLVQEDELSQIDPVFTTLKNVSDLRIKQSLLPPWLINNPDAHIIDNLNVMVTERCTLRCESCSNLMQYFQQPIEYSVDDIKKGFLLLTRQIDYVRNLGILGGEPFLYKGLIDVVDMICCSEKVVAVTIATNATILPNDTILSRLAVYDNLFISISDYGNLSRRRDELICKLESFNISYFLYQDMIWYKHAVVVDAYSRTPAEVQKVYEICNMNCMSLAGTLFSKCNVAVVLEKLKGIPPEYETVEKSTIDLSHMADKSVLSTHLRSNTAMGACYVCSGKSRMHADRIPPAIQTKTPLCYQCYCDDA